MNVTKYEIDMLGVGAADAFLIRFYDEDDKQHVVLVDAGYYDNGKDLIGLKMKQINALIEHSEWMTEVQVRMHLPFLAK